MLFGSLTSGHKFVSRSQSDSSRLTHLKSDLEKYKPELQTLSTAVPSKHKKYLVHENGFEILETPLEGQITSFGFCVVVDKVVDNVVVVVRMVVVVGGAVGQ